MVGITGPTSVDPEVVKVFALLFCSVQCRPPARTFESLVRFWRDVFNPRRACARVTVVVLCVCLSVCVCNCSRSSCFSVRLYPQATIHTGFS